jgi:transcriptional regulator GlxA family with amidase domain
MRLRLLENALEDHLASRFVSHPAVQFAMDAFARADLRLTVREIARGTGLSQRRFIQLFAREIGMAPKLFCRVRRFQRALAMVRPSRTPDWSMLAMECEYCDQSHLIRDFRDFADLTPTEYIRQHSERVMQNHVPIA